MNNIDPKYIVRRSGRGSIRARLLNGASNLALPALASALALTLSWPASELLAQCATTGTDQTCTNSIAITGGTTGISDTGTLTVTNTSTGAISGTYVGIRAEAVNVTGNSGTISATGPNGSAILATTDATVANSGTIEDTGDGAVAIRADGTATISNSGVIRTTGGPVSATIFATTVNVTDNAGRIEAANGPAIDAVSRPTVNNTSGMITATGAGNAAILSRVGSATFSNGSGFITDDGSAISARSVSVTGNLGAIEEVGVNGVAITRHHRCHREQHRGA